MASDSRIVVRLATSEDQPHLVEFNSLMAQETEAKALDLPTLRQGVASVFQKGDRGFYLVAELEGTVAGQLMITTEWSDWRNGYFWWIQSVYVPPQYRRRGIYRALNDQVRSLALTQGDVCGVRLYVDKDNTGAQQVYQRLGMSPTHCDLYEIEFDR